MTASPSTTVAGTSGVEIEDFLTVLAATSSSFASGSDAGTSFKTFLQRLTPESKKAAADVEEQQPVIKFGFKVSEGGEVTIDMQLEKAAVA